MPTMDVISKSLIHQVVQGMAHHLFGLNIVDLTELPHETRRVEARQADIVLKATDQTGEHFILHLELQSTNHPQMPLRMLRYYTDIALAHPDLVVHQYVVYTGQGKLSMVDQIVHPAWSYRYQLINMSALDYREFMVNDSPSALALAILCDFKEQPAEIVFETLLQRLKTLLADTPDDLLDYLKIMEFLSIDRDLESVFRIKESEMLSSINIERMPSYQMGVERGEKRGGQQVTQTIAERMLQAGYPIDSITKITGLSQLDLQGS